MRQTFVVGVAVLVLGVWLGARFFGAQLDINQEQTTKAAEQAARDIERLKAEHAWYRWYFSEYAATLRLEQYGEPTLDINRLLFEHADEFIPVEDVTAGIVCPKPSNGAFGHDYIYFAARMMPLPGNDGFRMFAMSYLGGAEFAHSNKIFDAILTGDQLAKTRHHTVSPFGLIDAWMTDHSFRDLAFEHFNDYGFSALMSYNSGDIDGDGKADFIFDEMLVLSSAGSRPSGKAPRRAMFQDSAVVAVEGQDLVRYVYRDGGLSESGRIELEQPVHPNVPYVVMPLPGSRIAVRTENALDIYENQGEDGIAYYGTIDGFVAGELQVGSVGDFTGDGEADVWLSQVNTPRYYPDKKDQVVLIRMTDIKPGANHIGDIAWARIAGSGKFSDYDGISTTLSPVAADILGDGRLDLSLTGHRHMNEAGAMYILPGAHITRGLDIDISDDRVIKLLGRAMSQFAPPFHHWDGTDFDNDGFNDIVVAVDNDLCSGLNAGAVYTLSGKLIASEWSRRKANGQ